MDFPSGRMPPIATEFLENPRKGGDEIEGGSRVEIMEPLSLTFLPFILYITIEKPFTCNLIDVSWTAE